METFYRYDVVQINNGMYAALEGRE